MNETGRRRDAFVSGPQPRADRLRLALDRRGPRVWVFRSRSERRRASRRREQAFRLSGRRSSTSSSTARSARKLGRDRHPGRCGARAGRGPSPSWSAGFGSPRAFSGLSPSPFSFPRRSHPRAPSGSVGCAVGGAVLFLLLFLVALPFAGDHFLPARGRAAHRRVAQPTPDWSRPRDADGPRRRGAHSRSEASRVWSRFLSPRGPGLRLRLRTGAPRGAHCLLAFAVLSRSLLAWGSWRQSPAA